MASSITERMIGAARLDPKTFEEVEADTTATPQAMTVVVLASLAAGIGALNQGVLAIVLTVIASLVGWFIWAGVTYLVGTKILPEPQTKTDMGQLLRTIGFAASPGLLRVVGIIPVIGVFLNFVISIWMLIAFVIAVRQALDYTSTGRAVGVCVIGWLIYIVVMIAVGTVFGLAAGVGSALTS
jgi:hypothetical protein